MSSKAFTPAESELLDSLKELHSLCKDVNAKLKTERDKVKAKDLEIERLNRQIRALIEENHHQKETLQTLKTRSLSVLEKL